jgi:hypothetical protein
MKNNGDYLIGSGILAAASWAETVQPIFSVIASLGAIVLAIFGIVNYWKKWKREEKNRLDSE